MAASLREVTAARNSAKRVGGSRLARVRRQGVGALSAPPASRRPLCTPVCLGYLSCETCAARLPVTCGRNCWCRVRPQVRVSTADTDSEDAVNSSDVDNGDDWSGAVSEADSDEPGAAAVSAPSAVLGSSAPLSRVASAASTAGTPSAPAPAASAPAASAPAASAPAASASAAATSGADSSPSLPQFIPPSDDPEPGAPPIRALLCASRGSVCNVSRFFGDAVCPRALALPPSPSDSSCPTEQPTLRGSPHACRSGGRTAPARCGGLRWPPQCQLCSATWLGGCGCRTPLQGTRRPHRPLQPLPWRLGRWPARRPPAAQRGPLPLGQFALPELPPPVVSLGPPSLPGLAADNPSLLAAPAYCVELLVCLHSSSDIDAAWVWGPRLLRARGSVCVRVCAPRASGSSRAPGPAPSLGAFDVCMPQQGGTLATAAADTLAAAGVANSTVVVTATAAAPRV